MFNIYNGRGEIVDTAATVVEADGVVTWLTTHDRANGPFHHAPAAQA
jgi:hypothetical protein